MKQNTFEYAVHIVSHRPTLPSESNSLVSLFFRFDLYIIVFVCVLFLQFYLGFSYKIKKILRIFGTENGTFLSSFVLIQFIFFFHFSFTNQRQNNIQKHFMRMLYTAVSMQLTIVEIRDKHRIKLLDYVKYLEWYINYLAIALFCVFLIRFCRWHKMHLIKHQLKTLKCIFADWMLKSYIVTGIWRLIKYFQNER